MSWCIRCISVRGIKILMIVCWFTVSISCESKTATTKIPLNDSTTQSTAVEENTEEINSLPASETINTRNITPEAVVNYAKTLIGTPYKYGSTSLKDGFDCSGFITHVFNNFDIAVPRSSVDFTNSGEEIPVGEALPGDLILFTGTDSTDRTVGHMGIIVANSDSTTFIHSTSGKAYGVTITPLNSYYQGRFVKTIRIFK